MNKKIKWLLLANKTEVTDSNERQTLALFASVTGIILNFILFLFKLLVGLLTGSVSITADAFNNLSDAGSSIVTFASYKMAAKPADDEHPFGHGRIEYAAMLAISMIIMYLGITLLMQSIGRIIKPEAIIFNWWAVLVVVVSILAKIWLSRFQMLVGKKARLETLKATSLDSLSDVFVTTATLISLITAHFTSISIDGYMGAIVSLFVLKAGFDVAKDALKLIIGEAPDPELTRQIMQILKDNHRIIGVHDLIIHSYGPGRYHATADVEVDSREDFFEIHDVIDQLEGIILKETSVIISLHMDPMKVNDQETQDMHRFTLDVINQLDEKMIVQDFRVVRRDGVKYILFDIELPMTYTEPNHVLKKMITDALKNAGCDCEVDVFINRGFF